MNGRRIVITGGPGTGKTAIINLLKDRDYPCFEEVIRDLTLAAKAEHEEKDQVSNPIAFVNDPLDFNRQLLNGRIAQFLKADLRGNPLHFFDRGIPDVLAYMRFFKQEYDDLFIHGCENHRYDMVFLLPPWEAIYTMDNERFETYDECVHIHEQLLYMYRQFNYHIHEVPHGTVEFRTEFILEIIDQH